MKVKTIRVVADSVDGSNQCLMSSVHKPLNLRCLNPDFLAKKKPLESFYKFMKIFGFPT